MVGAKSSCWGKLGYRTGVTNELFLLSFEVAELSQTGNFEAWRKGKPGRLSVA